jgi:hypothetical protein
MKSSLFIVLALLAIGSECQAQGYGIYQNIYDYHRDARSGRYVPYRFSRNEAFWYGYGDFVPQPLVPARAYYPTRAGADAQAYAQVVYDQVYRAIADEIFREQFAADVRQRVEPVRPVPPTVTGDQPARIHIPDFTPAPTTRPSIYERDNTRQMPVQPTSLRLLDGTLVSTSAIRYSGESEQHVIAWVRAGPGATGVADLGSRSQLKLLIGLARGGRMDVIGHPGMINDQPALFARVIQTPTQTLYLPQSSPTTRPSAKRPTTGPSASFDVSPRPMIRYTEQGVAGRP